MIVTMELGTSLFEWWTPNCTTNDYGQQFLGHDVDRGPFLLVVAVGTRNQQRRPYNPRSLRCLCGVVLKEMKEADTILGVDKHVSPVGV